MSTKRKTTKPARTITPHKGGRTTQLHGRFTPDEAALIQKVLERRGMTFSDWVAMLAGLEIELHKIESASK